MMSQEAEKVRKQMQIVCIDDLVPQDHLLRIIDKAIDWSFIYDLVRDTYSDGMGRPSIDPVTLIKIPLIQYLYGIKSMRQTIKEIEVNMAYRWFLGLELYDPVPHFSTFGKNYTRRFKDTDLFEQIFQHILEECYRFKLVDPTEIFVDATHVKARANNKKMQRRIAQQEIEQQGEQIRDATEGELENVRSGISKLEQAGGISDIGRDAAEAGRSKLEGSAGEYEGIISDAEGVVDETKQQIESLKSNLSGIFG